MYMGTGHERINMKIMVLGEEMGGRGEERGLEAYDAKLTRAKLFSCRPVWAGTLICDRSWLRCQRDAARFQPPSPGLGVFATPLLGHQLQPASQPI